MAFGGTDRSDPTTPVFEPRNPVGVGFRRKGAAFEEGMLPNIEDPAAPLESYGQATPPVGFGFVSPNWHPRAALAGTYDQAWREKRMPRLPQDFDRRFMNGASPGLIAAGYLRGDEEVAVVGVAGGTRAFRLPGVAPPRCRVRLARRDDVELQTRLDTVVVDTDASRLYLGWRAHLALERGPHDVRGVEIASA
jgi:hypothetical protein